MEIIFLLLLLLLFELSECNIIWPALYLEIGIFSPITITCSLLVECWAYKKVAKCGFIRGFVYTVIVNLVTLYVGLYPRLFLSLITEIIPPWNGTFSFSNWVQNLLLGALINTVIEYTILLMLIGFNVEKMFSFIHGVCCDSESCGKYVKIFKGFLKEYCTLCNLLMVFGVNFVTHSVAVFNMQN